MAETSLQALMQVDNNFINSTAGMHWRKCQEDFILCVHVWDIHLPPEQRSEYKMLAAVEWKPLSRPWGHQQALMPRAASPGPPVTPSLGPGLYLSSAQGS